jgi:hypothetical protein
MKTGAYTGTALPFATNKYVEKVRAEREGSQSGVNKRTRK